MTRRAFLHVASTKSGTTFLQQVLWSHRDLLREQGVLLPGRRRQHFLAALEVRDSARFWSDPDEVVGSWSALAEEAAAWEGDVVVSHELFAPATREQAGRAVERLGDHEVHVVVTARDLARQIPAEWQEHLKHRSVLTFPEFVSTLRADGERGPFSPNGYHFWEEQDLCGVVERWGVVPPERVHVVTVPPPTAPTGALWGRFAGLLGLAPADFDLGRARPNRSLRAEQAELLRRLNEALGERLPLPGSYPGTVKSVLAHEVLAERDGSRFGVVGDDFDFAVARARAMVAGLRTLGVDVVGDLEELVPRAPASASGDAAVPDAAVATEAVEALAEVLHRYADERARRQHLRRRLDEARARVREPDGGAR